MKRTVKDAIIEAKLTDEMMNTFFAQIGIIAIGGGLYLHSWIAFGLLLLGPLAIYLFSSKVNWCRIASIVLSCAYAIIWAITGFLIGWIFSVSASIVLCIIFLLPGVAYNWCAINYFSGK